MYPVTTTTAIILGLWLVVLSLRVIGARRSENTSNGDGGNETLSRRIRAQGNLSEYAPLGLILLLLAEMQGANIGSTAVPASIFVVGRLLHGYAFSFTSSWGFGRVGGMLMTFGGLILLTIANIWVLLA